MDYKKLAIPDVVLLTPKIYGDERGFFLETFRACEMEKLSKGKPFVQDNHSKSIQGTLRGLHYQVSRPQGKLVRVVQGCIFDVAVDLRKGSLTYGQWVGEYLSDENKKQLWIPEGFAHGFYVISPTAECVYKCTDYYDPELEKGLIWDDEALKIEWPLLDGETPLLSQKDKLAVSFSEAEKY